MKTKTTVIAITVLMVSGLFYQSSAQDKVQNTGAVKHVKIEIDHRGLHCPFLGVALKDKLKTIEGFSDFYIDKDDRFMTFTYPVEMKITPAELTKIPIDIGFSESIVHVVVDDKPFSNEGIK